jgi:hypothetical protein
VFVTVLCSIGASNPATFSSSSSLPNSLYYNVLVPGRWTWA